MIRIHDVNRRFDTRMRTVNGRSFLGTVSLPPNYSTRSGDLFLRRPILRVSSQCFLKIGESVATPDGRKYLLADNGEAFYIGRAYKSFRMVEMDRSVSWTRVVSIIDAVTRMATTGHTQPLGPLLCSIELVGHEEDKFHVPTKKYRMLTGSDVQIDDKIDGRYVVKEIEIQLGIKVCGIE